MLFGSSNKTFYSPIPITKRFQYRDIKADGVVKTIVKTSDFESLRNPHAVSLQRSKFVRTTLYKGAIQKEQFTDRSKTGGSDNSLPSSVLLLHHYRYLSEKEYDDKSCVRGHVDGKQLCNREKEKSYTLAEISKMGKQPHLASRPGTVFDDLAWVLLRDRMPKYRIYDDYLAWGDYT